MPSPATEQAVQALRVQGWRTLREILAALPQESRVSPHTFLKSWRPAHLVPSSLAPLVFRGYGVRGRRGGTVALWPRETERFVRIAREIQRFVYVRGRRPRQEHSNRLRPDRAVRSCASLRINLWALGYDFDPELIRKTLNHELVEFGELARKRGHRMSQLRKAATADASSKTDEEALDDLVGAHKARLSRAWIQPEAALEEFSALLVGRGDSTPLLQEFIARVEIATAAEFEQMRHRARTLLFFYLSLECGRRQMIHELGHPWEHPVEPELREHLGLLRQEYGRLDDAWRHLAHFPVLAAFLMYVPHSPELALTQWLQTTLPEYDRWTLWEALPPSLREVANR